MIVQLEIVSALILHTNDENSWTALWQEMNGIKKQYIADVIQVIQRLEDRANVLPAVRGQQTGDILEEYDSGCAAFSFEFGQDSDEFMK